MCRRDFEGPQRVSRGKLHSLRNISVKAKNELIFETFEVHTLANLTLNSEVTE